MRGARGLSRRELLTRVFHPRDVALAATGGLLWTHVASKAEGTELTIRPPGAREGRAFLASCTKCGLCVEACPYGALKLARANDAPTIGAPYLEPRETPCYMCPDAPCVRACPTGALVPETPIEDARMGLAVLTDHETCLAYRGLRCEVCYRTCPLIGRAITIETRPQERTGKHAFFLPVVSSENCTGCGMCEHACVLETPAIRVFPRGQVQGRLHDTYRFGWLEEAGTREGSETRQEKASDAGDNLDRILTEMHDLRVLEEP